MHVWYGQMCHPVRCFLHQEQFMFGERPRKPTIWNAWFQQWNTGELLWCSEQQYCGILLVLLLLFMAELLQGSMWTCWVIRRIPWSRLHFRMMQFPKMTMPPITQLELLSHDLKTMKVNFNIFPGQHNHHIWTSLNHYGPLFCPTPVYNILIFIYF
jgi:hypothetical protein